jgi:hypothetical protein
MKSIILVIIGLLTAVAGSPAADLGFTVRSPLISPSLRSNIVWLTTNLVPQGQYLNAIETEWSHSYNSARMVPDYFIVGSTNADGGKLIIMDTIPTSTGGIIGQPVFRSTNGTVLSFTGYNTVNNMANEYDYTVNENGFVREKYHYGTLNIGDGETVRVIIGYRYTPRYPTVSISWGEGADLEEWGTVLDDYSTAVVIDPSITVQSTRIANIVNSEDTAYDGIYLTVESPSGVKHVIESTADFKTWSVVQKIPVFVDGHWSYYHFPPASGNPGFFRSKKK